jgi:Ca2+-binding EF-hand superfamily protein
MGNAAGRPAAAAAPPPPAAADADAADDGGMMLERAPTMKESLESRMAAAIVAKAADGSVKPVPFNRFVLRLPRLMPPAMARVRAAFAAADADADGSLSLEELRGACTSLGYPAGAADAGALADAFAGADRDASGGLGLQELLGCLCLLHLLGDASAADAAVAAALDAAEGAFMAVGGADDGTVSHVEFAAALAAAGAPKGSARTNGAMMPEPSFIARRFSELDADKDDELSFLDFVQALHEWSADDEGVDAEDEG